MKIIVKKNYDEASHEIFKLIKEVVVENSAATLGLATGSTPIGLYKEMIRDHREQGTSYAAVQTYNLDEYVGLPREHKESYYTFMHENLFKDIDIKEENTHLPYGSTEADCRAYDEELSKVQVDVQVLGIGGNAHIGFNEPGSSFTQGTHIVELAPETRESNARFFDGDLSLVPTQAITMGIDTIMKAKKILLIASGEQKAEAVKQMIEGDVVESVPASILQKHNDVVIILDEAAASKLSK